MCVVGWRRLGAAGQTGIYAQFMPHTRILLLQIVLNRYMERFRWHMAGRNLDNKRLLAIQLQISPTLKYCFFFVHLSGSSRAKLQPHVCEASSTESPGL